MKPEQNVRDILEAIESVKARAVIANSNGDASAYRQLMGDLTALEVCLVAEATKLMEEFDKIA